MKTISLVVFNRPDYTLATLNSLRANGIKGYKLFIGAEPGCPEVLKICESVDFMPVELIVNQRRLGVNWNNKRLYDYLFEKGSKFNVAIEDDTPLCPDALDLAEWFYSHPQRDDYLLLNLFSASSSVDEVLNVKVTKSMCPWGYCLTRQMYKKYVDPCWMCDQRGWDFSICSIMNQKALNSLTPVLSRSQNIGRLHGNSCTPEYHDQCFPSMLPVKEVTGMLSGLQVNRRFDGLKMLAISRAAIIF